MTERRWKPPTPEEKARKKAEREVQRRQTLKENLWEKVECWLKDLWRPYHGSTKHREDADGNQLIEKKKSGGHTPLNAAVMAQWQPGKLKDSREMLTRHLYRLACGTPFEVVCYAEIRDLFGSYGAGDSDLDELRRTAAYHGPHSESASKVRAVECGIGFMVDRMIEDGVKNPDLWADFPLPGVPSNRTLSKDERYRRYYLAFVDECSKLEAEKRAEYRNAGKEAPEIIRVRNRATQNVAEREGTTDRTVREAVAQCESGYVDLEAS